MFALKFLSSLVLGCIFASLVALAQSPENATPVVVFGVAATFAMFGFLPAVLVGLPCLILMKRREIERRVAFVLQTAGGATIGAVLMTVTFTSLENWGALVGGSIGFTQAMLLYSGEPANAVCAES